MSSDSHHDSPQPTIEGLLYVRLFGKDGAQTDVFVDDPTSPANVSAFAALTGQGGRLFGGITLGQTLNAAQQTVGTDFVAHSMHCSFVSGRIATIPAQYHVEKIKDGRQFCTRFVRAVQNNRTFYVALISFTSTTRQDNGLQYGLKFPKDVPFPPAEYDVNETNDKRSDKVPFLHHSVGVQSSTDNDEPSRVHQWMRARNTISGQDGHLAALACMSDSYFLAGAPHTHDIYDFDSPPVSEVYDDAHRLSLPSQNHRPVPRPHLGFLDNRQAGERKKAVTSMASLDHTLYFHDSSRLRADQWLLAEIDSSWAGSGRTVVNMKIWGQDGTLMASCTQEGLVSVGDMLKKQSRL